MRRLICLLGLLVVLVGSAGSSAAAYNPLSGACAAQGGAGKDSSACAPGANITGSNGVLKKVSTIVASVAGIAAVIVIIIGGLQYVLSTGDPQKAASARSAIIGGVVGLVIIASAQGIILFVLGRLK